MPKEYVTTKMMISRGGEDMEIDIDGFVVYDVEVNHGADADGNRGMSMTFVEECYDLAGYDADGREIELTENEIEYGYDLLADKFLN